jgi:REP element-mobilizing transposase RayT
MSFVKVMIHAVWRTKSSKDLITKDFRPILLKHIRLNAKAKGIFIDTINARPDHIHCLLALNADMTIAKSISLIKGESSHWVNKNKLIPFRFGWSSEYYAVSVSESQLGKVRDYIKNQDAHHAKMSYDEEHHLIFGALTPIPSFQG